jgi:hypothetical protein
MLTTLTMTAILAGAVLGLRFKILVLVPATVIGSAATLGASITQGNGLWFLLLALVLVISALQIGYLSGAFIRSVTAGTRDRKDPHGIIVAVQRSAR